MSEDTLCVCVCLPDIHRSVCLELWTQKGQAEGEREREREERKVQVGWIWVHWNASDSFFQEQADMAKPPLVGEEIGH